MPRTRATPRQFATPIRFCVYLNTATNSPANATALVPCDTKVYDVGNNVDIVTNKGRFTVPAGSDGLYTFTARISCGANIRMLGMIYKNGVEILRGIDIQAGGVQAGTLATGDVPLVATDYVEFLCYTSGSAAYEIGQTKAFFQGRLVSA